MSQDEYQARLTLIAHETIKYLARQGHLVEEDAEDLLQTIVVVPVANNKLFGRVREYLFGDSSKEDKTISQYVITQIL
jgi:hypothetical protein